MARALPEWTNKLAHDTAGARAGLFLRTMRNAAGLTQVQLGEAARMKQADISDLENGKGKMKRSQCSMVPETGLFPCKS